MLSRCAAYCLEIFLSLVRNAFNPSPNVSELTHTWDFSKWFNPCFQAHIENMKGPHRFVFSKSGSAKTGAVLRTALWSDSGLSDPVEIITKLPKGAPDLRAGRPLFYALNNGKAPDQARLQKYLSEFDDLRNNIDKLATEWNFTPYERESWRTLLSELDEQQRASSQPFKGWWPKTPKEVEQWIEGHSGTEIPTSLDDGIPEAEEVEAQVRSRVLREEQNFLPIHAGAAKQRHKVTNPVAAAAENNIVIIDVSEVEGDDDHVGHHEGLGTWESQFLVGVVKRPPTLGAKKSKNKNQPLIQGDNLLLQLYEPYHVDKRGKPIMPFWLHIKQQADKKRPVTSSWEDVVALPWKLIDCIPKDYFEHLSGKKANPRSIRTECCGKKIDVVLVDEKDGYRVTQPRERCVAVLSSTAAERQKGGVVKFDAATVQDLKELAILAD